MDSHASTATENDETRETGNGAESASNLSELTLGSGAPAEATEAEPHAAPTIRGRIDKFGTAMGTGRRKTSVARVRINKGNGKLTINNRPLEDYFRVERDRALIEGPLLATDMLGKVDVWVRAQGGGTTGQAGAVVLGIARALQAMDPGLHARLSEGNFLTRDGRMVERKKYGRKKARRSFQFSKR
jgi:small subunit ribosomal protein S9